jgi:hypothetical protein
VYKRRKPLLPDILGQPERFRTPHHLSPPFNN